MLFRKVELDVPVNSSEIQETGRCSKASVLTAEQTSQIFSLLEIIGVDFIRTHDYACIRSVGGAAPYAVRGSSRRYMLSVAV